MDTSPTILRRVFVAILCCLAIWPAVQWFLVAKYDANPWKLCGFAMYCTPRRTIIDVTDTTREPRLIPLPEIQEIVGTDYSNFCDWRDPLGALWSPDNLAHTFLRNSGDMNSLRIEIHVLELNGATAKLEVRSRSYNYDRSDL